LSLQPLLRPQPPQKPAKKSKSPPAKPPRRTSPSKTGMGMGIRGQQASSLGASAIAPKKNYSAIFGGGSAASASDGYDFEVQTDYGKKRGGGGRLSPGRSSYDGSAGAGGGGVGNLSKSLSAIPKDADAMAKAAAMLARYAEPKGKAGGAAEWGPRHKPRLPESYEDDMSLDDSDGSQGRDRRRGGAGLGLRAHKAGGAGGHSAKGAGKWQGDDFEVDISVSSSSDGSSGGASEAGFVVEASKEYVPDDDESDGTCVCAYMYVRM